jgi:hypothetical protein
MSIPNFLAFYLPQFHPTPENDAWWGKGFTEWTNVTKAQPLYRKHYQPHLPSDLGFYDLRVPEVRQAQADLARQYGIMGFCYYHYWFEGKRLLTDVTDAMIKSGDPDFPFCFCWANETWSKRWLGEDKEILIQQTYSKQDFKNHARHLAGIFSDRRYIRVNNRPVFIIYRFIGIPAELNCVETMREEWNALGVAQPYLVAVDVHNRHFDYISVGFDAILAFEPALGELPDAFDDAPSFSKLKRNLANGIISQNLKIYDYEEATSLMNTYADSSCRIPSLLVGWDNTARRAEKGIIFENCNPESFERVLRKRMSKWKQNPHPSNLFFLNAWNEWAEGNHLEPDVKYGLGYLKKFKSVIDELKSPLHLC